MISFIMNFFIKNIFDSCFKYNKKNDILFIGIVNTKWI